MVCLCVGTKVILTIVFTTCYHALYMEQKETNDQYKVMK